MKNIKEESKIICRIYIFVSIVTFLEEEKTRIMQLGKFNKNLVESIEHEIDLYRSRMYQMVNVSEYNID